VAAALAVVFGSFETPSIVVVKDDMLALVPDHVAYPIEIFGVFGYKKRSRSE
jgi:hypothetical protein